MRKYIFSLIVIGWISLSCNINLGADEIIEKYIEARGGYENIKAVQTKIYKGHYIEPGYDLLLNARVHQKRPFFRLVGDPSRGFAEGYDGASWEYFKKKGVVRTTGEAEAATRRGAEFDESLIDYKQKRHKVDLKGRKIINGFVTYEIEVLLFDGWVKSYFIDKSTFLIVAYRKAMSLHARGEAIDYLVTITDYKRVGKVLYPFTQIERNFHTNKMISTTMWDTLIVNDDIPDSVFAPPKVVN